LEDKVKKLEETIEGAKWIGFEPLSKDG
jgi:hypothetical protein